MQDTIVIRRSTDLDGPAVARLAELDSRPIPEGELLLAIVAGELRAALPVAGGELVATPFSPAEEVGALLRLRASHARGAGAPESPGRGLRNRKSWRALSWRPREARA